MGRGRLQKEIPCENQRDDTRWIHSTDGVSWDGAILENCIGAVWIGKRKFLMAGMFSVVKMVRDTLNSYKRMMSESKVL